MQKTSKKSGSYRRKVMKEYNKILQAEFVDIVFIVDIVLIGNCIHSISNSHSRL